MVAMFSFGATQFSFLHELKGKKKVELKFNKRKVEIDFSFYLMYLIMFLSYTVCKIKERKKILQKVCQVHGY